MKTFKNVFIIVSFAIAAFLIFNAQNKQKLKPQMPFLSQEYKNIDESVVVIKTYNVPNNYVDFDVSYPQFKNASAAFNKKIEDLIVTSAIDHQKNAEENWKARIETATSDSPVSKFPDEKMSFYTTWEPVQVNQNIISILIRYGGFSGGAHGYENLVSFNYNTVTNKEIPLSSLFTNNTKYLASVSEYTRADLKKQFIKQAEINTLDGTMTSMLEEGTKPILSNFSTFAFTPDEIIFYFAQYQVAPYVFGEPQVVMPRS